MKKITRKVFAALTDGVSFASVAGEAVSAKTSVTPKAMMKPRMNFGKRSQISLAFASSPGTT